MTSKSGQQGDKYLRFGLLCSHLYMHIYLKCFGSSFIANQTGHKLVFDDMHACNTSCVVGDFAVTSRSREALVNAGWAICLLSCTNGCRKRSFHLVGTPFLAF